MLLAADQPAETSGGWGVEPHTLGRALLYMLIFAASGIIAAIAGYKLFDLFTPGDLHKEIVEKQNVAAAIVAASIVLGVCIIIAAAMVG
jgi:putative membrane protein